MLSSLNPHDIPRLQLDADIMNMQLEMLEAAKDAGEEPGTDASLKQSGRQR